MGPRTKCSSSSSRSKTGRLSDWLGARRAQVAIMTELDKIQAKARELLTLQEGFEDLRTEAIISLIDDAYDAGIQAEFKRLSGDAKLHAMVVRTKEARQTCSSCGGWLKHCGCDGWTSGRITNLDRWRIENEDQEAGRSPEENQSAD